MWVDHDIPNWFPTLKNFYRLPFSKWPSLYHTNSTLFESNVLNWFPISTNFYRSPFSKWPPQFRKNSTLFDYNHNLLLLLHYPDCCRVMYCYSIIIIILPHIFVRSISPRCLDQTLWNLVRISYAMWSCAVQGWFFQNGCRCHGNGQNVKKLKNTKMIIAGYSPNRNWWNFIGTISTSSGTR